MLYTGSTFEVSNEYDEIWYIVRKLKVLKKIPGVVVKHVPELSPSDDLYHEYLKAKSNQQWDKECFENGFKPRFLKEMRNPESNAKLDELYKLSRNKNVLIVCYCPNESRCHRSIIKELIREREKEEMDRYDDMER